MDTLISPPAIAPGSSTPTSAAATAAATAASAGAQAKANAKRGGTTSPRSAKPSTPPGKPPAPTRAHGALPSSNAPHPELVEGPPYWLGWLMQNAAGYLHEQGAVEILALQGAAILYTDVPLDLDRGRWLLVRFEAPVAEVETQLLALLYPAERAEAHTPPET